MSWGAWILVLVYPALVAAALVSPPAWLRDTSVPIDRLATRLEAPNEIRPVALESADPFGFDASSPLGGEESGRSQTHQRIRHRDGVEHACVQQRRVPNVPRHVG